MKNLFRQMTEIIDAAIVDVTLSKMPRGTKTEQLKMLIYARENQEHVANTMDNLYPANPCPLKPGKEEGCDDKTCSEKYRSVCESRRMKRLGIEGRFILAIDELPDADPLQEEIDSRGPENPDRLQPRTYNMDVVFKGPDQGGEPVQLPEAGSDIIGQRKKNKP